MAIGTNGNDTISATAIDEALYGLDGDDSLTATSDLHNIISGRGANPMDSDFTIAAGSNVLINQLGGGGNDVGTIDAIIQAGSEAGKISVIAQGGANDDNLDSDLDILSGSDVLIKSLMEGGEGADTFVFDTGTDLDRTQVSDFENEFDILEFTGLTDTGAAGLADDIDALTSSITDNGTDIQLNFTNGTVAMLAGVGDGTISSVGQLVDDPLAQLIA